MTAPFRRPLFATALLAAALSIGGAVLLKTVSLTGVERAIIALLPVPAFVALIVLMMRQVSRLDGLMQRVALEAAAFAAMTTGVLALTYGQLEKARVVPHLNPGFVVAALFVTYSIGHVVSIRRYR